MCSFVQQTFMFVALAVFLGYIMNKAAYFLVLDLQIVDNKQDE